MGRIKVECIHESANSFKEKLEAILNQENQDYYNIIPIHTQTAGEFKAIIITAEEECDLDNLLEVEEVETPDEEPEVTPDEEPEVTTDSLLDN